MNDDTPPVSSRFFAKLAAFAVVLVSALGLFTLESQRRACADRIEVRADARAVWTYVVGVATDPGSERVQRFVMFLDNRLPPLECTWWGSEVPEER